MSLARLLLTNPRLIARVFFADVQVRDGDTLVLTHTIRVQA